MTMDLITKEPDLWTVMAVEQLRGAEMSEDFQACSLEEAIKVARQLTEEWCRQGEWPAKCIAVRCRWDLIDPQGFLLSGRHVWVEVGS